MNHSSKKKEEAKISAEEMQKRDAQAQKIYEITKEFLKLRQKIITNEKPLEFSELVAQMCPDFATNYNFRRETFENVFKSLTEDEQYKILLKEVDFIFSLLKRNPKSYPLWNHRQWLVQKSMVLEQTIKPQMKLVDKELALCTIMIQKDERNFHAWNYRNWLIRDVLKNDLAYIDKEIEFTKKKINDNFSNFSAFHFRSKNLKRKYLIQTLKTIEPEIIKFSMPLSVLQQEIDLVSQAIYMQPNEQGIWQHFNWLLNYFMPFSALHCKQIQSEAPHSAIFQIKFSTKISDISHNFQILDSSDTPLKIPYKITSLSNENYSQYYQIEFQNSDLETFFKNQNNNSHFVLFLQSNIDRINSSNQDDQQIRNTLIQEYIEHKSNFISSKFQIKPSQQEQQQQQQQSSNSNEKILFQIEKQKLLTTDQQLLNEAFQTFKTQLEFVEQVIEQEPENHFSLLQIIHFRKIFLDLKLINQENFTDEDITQLQKCLEIIEQIFKLRPNQHKYLSVLKQKWQLRIEIIQDIKNSKTFDQIKLQNKDFEIDDLLSYVD